MKRYSQSQKAVFALYRKGLRLIRTKPEDARHEFLLYLRHFFRHPHQGGGISKRDFTTVEYMMRRGSRMIESFFANPNTKHVQLSGPVLQEMEALGLASRWHSRPKMTK
ncbi:hypothetical protein MBRA1_002490 [Malassezia brasiliensis]|uniref:Succinate dehydrogenase assembly factor 1, mitochondrial n=1 Tax=Malassezia brasiliensis TaxID=1821822 RepID=A0AAF0IQA1_9BASI|nr:hypothetical protein MBRA1_002490 [Malassezia brasiliensis]